MHYCLLDVKSGLACVLPLLVVLEVTIAAMLYLTDWVPLEAKAVLMSIYLIGAISTGACWTGAILFPSPRLLFVCLGYQVIIISVSYLLGFYVLMRGAVALDIRASEKNYESLQKLVLGSLVYVVGPLELYTWRRVKYFRQLLNDARPQMPNKSMEQVCSPEQQQYAAIEKVADTSTDHCHI